MRAAAATEVEAIDQGWDDATIADRCTTYVLEIDGASESSLVFTEGQAKEPLSIGTMGTWKVIGPGVLDKHAFVHFDGRCLFMCSTDPSCPVIVDGRSIGTRWTELAPPCRLELGSVVAKLRSTKREDTTERSEKRELTVFSESQSSTRIDALPTSQEDASPVPSPAIVRSSRLGKLAAVVAVGAMTTVAVVTARRFVHGDAPGPATSAAPSVAASSVASALSDSSISPLAAGSGVVVHPAPPRASTSSKAPAFAFDGRNRPGEPAARAISDERAAADSLQRGDLAAALALYEKLARGHPDNPAFSASARILRQRIAHGRAP